MDYEVMCYDVGNANRVASVLLKEMRELNREPTSGFLVEPDQKNLLKWKAVIFGPPGTIYQGGYFKGELDFPLEYPFSPPRFRFITPMWHPNIYTDGRVCISILHPPTEDLVPSGELPCERWNPMQNVRTVLLSVISMLAEPNISSPANVDASVEYRNWKKEGDCAFLRRIDRVVEQSKQEAKRDNVEVPQDDINYCPKKKPSGADSGDDFNDYDDYEADISDSDG